LPEHIQGRVTQRRLETAHCARVGLRRATESVRAVPGSTGIAFHHAPANHSGTAPTALFSTKRETL